MVPPPRGGDMGDPAYPLYPYPLDLLDAGSRNGTPISVDMESGFKDANPTH